MIEQAEREAVQVRECVKARPDLLPWVPLVAVVGLTAGLYYRALEWWYYEWTANGSFYAHGVFIPLFVGVMVWRDRERLRALPVRRSWWGLALLLPAFALVLFAYRADVTLTLSISFILLLIGSVLLLAGPAMTRALLFPLLFLISMVPLVPNSIINAVAFPIQLSSARLASTLLNVAGFTNVRHGTEIHLESYVLAVELPCSGFKTLIGLLSFSGAFAYLVEGPARRRWLLFLCAAPLAVLVNGARIALIGVVGESFSGAAAAAFHDWSGLLMLMLAFLALFWLAKALGCERFLRIPLKETASPHDGREAVVETANHKHAKPPCAESELRETPYHLVVRGMAPGLYLLMGLLILSCAGARAVSRPATHYPTLRPRDIPSNLDAGRWRQLGSDRPIARDVEGILNPETWTDREYVARAPHAAAVNLLVSGGSNRRIFHDPHECFMGVGYTLRDLGVEQIRTPVGPVRVMESVAETTGDHTQTLLMFVYLVDGQQIQTTARVHTSLMWHAIFGESGRPSYFLRFRQLTPGIDETRRQELRDFVRSVWTAVGPRVTAAPAH